MKHLIVVLLMFLLVNSTFSQEAISIGNSLPDFTLESFKGEKVTPVDLHGKKVLYMFVRGKVGDHWCQICHYQYAELSALEEKEHIRDKYNLEIIFVLPYSADEVRKWVEAFPHQMDVIEGWKNPDNYENLSPGRKNWTNTARKYFKNSYKYEEDRIATPFPILIDADRQLSKSLGIFTTLWDNSYVEQNQPTIFIVDETGIVKFKYFSQSALDRPDADYLLNYIEKMM